MIAQITLEWNKIREIHKSLPAAGRQAYTSVIQTIYIVKAHGGELKVEKEEGENASQFGL